MGHSPNPAGVIMALPLAVSKDEQDKAATDNSRQVQEVVATPSKGRWMDVSPQADPPSPDEAISESGTAEESGTASEESGDPPVPTEPAHVALPCVSEEWFECNDEQQSGHHWKVVGGVEAGGILVREGRLLSSTLLAARLETGAVVCAKQVDGVRLEYELVSGRGPTSGWVSMKARGKDLLVALDLVALGLSGVGCPAAADAKVPPSRRPLIIFDWDDTLCPTTALEGMGDTDLCPEIEERLRELSQLGWLCLSKAIELGARVVIVTNATEGWVQASCERWLPKLLPLISSLDVISARSRWEPHGVSSPTGWKARTFESLAFYDDVGIPPHLAFAAEDVDLSPVAELWKDLIVVGDASFEHDALLRISNLACRDNGYKHLEVCRCKSVRFRLRPSIAQLCAQLSTLNKQMENVIACERSYEFRLVG
mmetsp:Transcript_58374/g.136461  ORF Transcript_58374/g.136461 Transcript_58374/m.136461 type:complete len:427 (-) Transcript_58374:43-1323(-)